MAPHLEESPKRDAASRLCWPNPNVADGKSADGPTCTQCGGSTADMGGAEHCSSQCQEAERLTR